MTGHRRGNGLKAFENPEFLNGTTARPLRILAEYLEPESRFETSDVSDTIVFFGSSRVISRDAADQALTRAHDEQRNPDTAERAVAMSRYYEDARELARRLTLWSKGLEDARRRFVICTGGGPGIMEAANRGASEARGMNIGLNISIPSEQHGNPYVTRELGFDFHYFFMRKFWFVYLAKALVVFPGGFGTMDEFFEVMTLIQTGKVHKRMPVVLYGRAFWDRVLNLEVLVEHGMIDARDLDLFLRTDSVEDAFAYITQALAATALESPGGRAELA